MLIIIFRKEMEYNMPNIIADLAALTKKTNNFDQLRQLLPLVAQLKRTQVNNKQMNQMFGIMNSAINQIKAMQGSSHKIGSNFSHTIDKMIGELNQQVAKLEDSFRDLESKTAKMQKSMTKEMKNENEVVTIQIQNQIQMNTRKIKEVIAKQNSQLSSSGQNNSNDHFKINMLRNKLLKNKKINKGVQECEVTLGQMRCYSDLLQFKGENDIDNDDFRHQINSFIRSCDKHFQRQVQFVCQKLKIFQKMKTLTPYQQNLFYQYYSWASRLKISLESAILKVSAALRQAFLHLKNKSTISRWQQAVASWQNMLSSLKQLLK